MRYARIPNNIHGQLCVEYVTLVLRRELFSLPRDNPVEALVQVEVEACQPDELAGRSGGAYACNCTHLTLHRTARRHMHITTRGYHDEHLTFGTRVPSARRGAGTPGRPWRRPLRGPCRRLLLPAPCRVGKRLA